MAFIIALLVPRGAKSMGAFFGSHRVEFVPRRLDSGEPVFVGETSDKEAIRTAKSMRGHYRVAETLGFEGDEPPAAPAPPSKPPPAPAAPAPPSKPPPAPEAPVARPPPVAAAIANGWSEVDIAGAGEGGAWGVEGGRSTFAGLTMAEMALCVPPPGWAEKRATRWPWEVLGWKPPGQGWVAPKAPVKPGGEPVKAEPRRGAADPDDGGAGGAGAGGGGGDDLDEDTDGGGEGGEGGGGGAPPSEDAKKPAAPKTRPEEALAGWKTEEIEAAVKVLHGKWVEAGGPPSISKANYWLDKNNIRRVKAAELAALLDKITL